MSEKNARTVVWVYIILSLVAFVRVIIVGDPVIDSIIGTAGIIGLNLAAWAVILRGEDE